MSTASFVKSSTTVRHFTRRPLASASITKSIGHPWLGRPATPVARGQSLCRGACDGAAQPALPHGTSDRCACDWRVCLRVPPGRAAGGTCANNLSIGLLAARATGAYERKLKQLSSVPVLIVD